MLQVALFATHLNMCNTGRQRELQKHHRHKISDWASVALPKATVLYISYVHFSDTQLIN